jgi:hypothetical protein
LFVVDAQSWLLHSDPDEHVAPFCPNGTHAPASLQ